MTWPPLARPARLRKPLGNAIGLGHPWIYADAIEPIRAEPGAVVTVTDKQGRFVARGVADGGPIAVRVWATRDEPVAVELVRRRARQAAAIRDRWIPEDTNAYRLLHGEGDRMPGVVCDVYDRVAVLQLDGSGAAAWRDVIVDALEELLRARGVEALVVRSGRRAERRSDLAWGKLDGAPLEVRERGMRLLADVERGQKTGLFLDHRESRARVRSIARGMRVLNLYGYTGAFSVAAALGGASRVTTVDVSEPAIDLAARTWALNGLDPGVHEAVVRDVPDLLRAAKANGPRYDLVIADPPSFAPSERSVAKALESYRALHASALARVERGGIYLAASCSSHVTAEDFDATLRDGARAARAVLQILERWGAPPDHPRLLAFPEGDYLKVVLARVSD